MLSANLRKTCTCVVVLSVSYSKSLLSVCVCLSVCLSEYRTDNTDYDLLKHVSIISILVLF